MDRTPRERSRILVIDSSPVFGTFVSDLLGLTPDLECVGLSYSLRSAAEILDRCRPDAIVLGLHATSDGARGLRALRGLPVLAVSVDNPMGAELTVDALQHGAHDFIVRQNAPELGDLRFRDELRSRLRTLVAGGVSAKLSTQRPHRRAEAISIELAQSVTESLEQRLLAAGQRIIVAGAGAGGPRALLQLFAQLQAPLPPMVIAQRIPASFLSALARRLDTLSPIHCKVAQHGEVLQPNTAYLAPVDRRTVVVREHGKPTLSVHANNQREDAHPGPSTDALMQSAAMVYGNKCLGMLLTGNGRDGVEGARAIGVAGGFVLGQDAENCYVPGTCQIANRSGYIDRPFQLEDAADALATVAPYLGRPEISIVRPPSVDPGLVHACAT